MPSRQEEDLAFVRAIKADRYDHVTRLVYADWLDDNDRPEDANEQRRWTVDWQRSEDYVKEFCKRADLNYAYFLVAARKHLDNGSPIECNMNASNQTMDENMAELWANVATLLRVEVEAGRSSDPFTCGGDCNPDGTSWEEGP